MLNLWLFEPPQSTHRSLASVPGATPRSGSAQLVRADDGVVQAAARAGSRPAFAYRRAAKRRRQRERVAVYSSVPATGVEQEEKKQCGSPDLSSLERGHQLASQHPCPRSQPSATGLKARIGSAK
ncbi:hypothetical protein AAFF_G00263180 [Aldrovandia affinis]|uniref:Uncharacterized protein n=1 Tax=Aldrovandia affinis TaxID=143900 RepID=A0AAD7WT64_9TELE|nr:hypothetical protein AAFF_G00263180 [Aldrovandia affinis]